MDENSYLPLTFYQLSKRGGYRLQVLDSKIEEKTYFTTVDNSEIDLDYVSASYSSYFANSDIGIIKEIGGRSINKFPFFSHYTCSYSFNDLVKTPEFGGKGKGAGTIVEDHNLFLLKKEIHKIKQETNSNYINVVLGGKKYIISEAETQQGMPKADFYLKHNDIPQIYISHKKAGHKGPSANDFIRWSGYTMYKEHNEVSEFNEALVKFVVDNKLDGLPRKTRFIKPIDDSLLIQKLIYGHNFGKEHCKDNIHVIMQGKIQFIKVNNNEYELVSEHTLIPPNIPQDDYYPYLTSSYRGDRKMFGILNNEAIVMTKHTAHGASNIYQWSDGKFIKIK
tara:strand:- start:1529 stop:2536 length:1008 start_codon:yes stop_codon:yes gene_type:complete